MSGRPAILHDEPAETPWRVPHTARLPGTIPVDTATWLRIDATYAAQMAERRALLVSHRDDVLALATEARLAADELLTRVLDILALRSDFTVGPVVHTPDGAQIPIDRDHPLATLGALVQEDLCILIKDGPEHRLAGAVLCFPAGWTLQEKMHRPLLAVHNRVEPYDERFAKRVQRLCDGVTWDRPVMRANYHPYATAQLYAPLSENGPDREKPADCPYLRVERQILRRLPDTGAVVFSILTSVTPMAALPPEDRAVFQNSNTSQAD